MGGALGRWSAAIATHLFSRSIRPAFVFMRDGLGVLVFDRRRGTTTAGEVQLAELGIAEPDRVDYKPSRWLTLWRILPRREVSPDDVLIDLGSGKGRVILQAARYPLKRVVGVEVSEELNRIAKANLEHDGARLRCGAVELVTSDVLAYALPPDVTIVYLNNPFRGEIFRAVIAKLIVSVDRHPRRVRIVYSNPVEHEALMATGRFRLVRRLSGMRPTREWSRSAATHLYEVLERPPDQR
jgi:SAM-dependent methyltransferase